MNTHRYLRAYMAGIVVPTVVVAFVIMVFIIARHVFHIPIPIERVVIFPVGLVPSVFGLWNMVLCPPERRPASSLGHARRIASADFDPPGHGQRRRLGVSRFQLARSRLVQRHHDPLRASDPVVWRRGDRLLPGVEIPGWFLQQGPQYCVDGQLGAVLIRFHLNIRMLL